jgi:hypothetical protein
VVTDAGVCPLPDVSVAVAAVRVRVVEASPATEGESVELGGTVVTSADLDLAFVLMVDEREEPAIDRFIHRYLRFLRTKERPFDVDRAVVEIVKYAKDLRLANNYR